MDNFAKNKKSVQYILDNITRKKLFAKISNNNSNKKSRFVLIV